MLLEEASARNPPDNMTAQEFVLWRLDQLDRAKPVAHGASLVHLFIAAIIPAGCTTRPQTNWAWATIEYERGTESR